MPDPLKRTIALRTVVVSTLATVLPKDSKAYFQQAQNDHPQIYAVYTVDEIDNTDGRWTYEVEVNVMDYGTNTSTVENLADDIQAAFNKHIEINNNIGVYFYADRRNSVEEEDRNILRRRLTFSAYLYERGTT